MKHFLRHTRKKRQAVKDNLLESSSIQFSHMGETKYIEYRFLINTTDPSGGDHFRLIVNYFLFSCRDCVYIHLISKLILITGLPMSGLIILRLNLQSVLSGLD